MCFLLMTHLVYLDISYENQIRGVPSFLCFSKLVETMCDCKIKIYQSDGGKEFDNGAPKEHFTNHDIYFSKTCPNALEQNGVAEQNHHYIVEMARTFLIDAHLFGQF